ncbi:MAG: signal peptidase II [Dehalococcoidia bacterium]
MRTRELFLFLPAAAVVAADQLTKVWIRSFLAYGRSIPEDGPVRLTHIENSGAAFGILANQGILITITAIAGVAALLLYYRYPAFNIPSFQVALGMALGGAVGNLIDRLRFGQVTDFIDLRVWPVFNLADSAIVVGMGLLGLLLLIRKEPGTPG